MKQRTPTAQTYATRYSAHRRPPATLHLDRCELLLATGLVADARSAAEAAVAEAAASGHAAELSEARLRLAEAAVAGGDWSVAFEHARPARPRPPALGCRGGATHQPGHARGR